MSGNGRDRRKVSKKEMRLWMSVARTVKPQDAQPKAQEAPAEPKPAPSPAVSPPPPPPKRVKHVKQQPPAVAKPTPAPPRTPLNPYTGLDGSVARRMRKGRIDPDARIDLHGMTAARAHTALAGFIANAQLTGWRDDGVGVLRRMAPEWLRAPPISNLVTGVYPAHIRHGGEGALYVYLRRKRAR